MRRGLLLRNRVSQNSNAFYCHFNHVACQYRAHSAGSSRRDQIARKQCHNLRDVTDHNVERKYKVPCIALLSDCPIDAGFDKNSGPRIDLIAHHDQISLPNHARKFDKAQQQHANRRSVLTS